jgi:osmotically-inducible protein OsmY
MRRLFEADPALASSAQGVRITVLDNRIIMSGFVLTQEDQRTLHRAIHDMPGVRHDFGVDDRVQVE